MNPTWNTKYFVEKGKYFREHERWAEAEVAFQRATDADPMNAVAHYWLAWCLEKREDFPRSIAQYIRAVELCQNNRDYLASSANMLAEFNQFDLAISLSTKALSLDPTSICLLNMHAKLLQARGDEHLAKSYYAKALCTDDGYAAISKSKEAGNLVVILRDEQINRYSNAALLGAVWACDELRDVPFILTADLIRATEEALSKYLRVIVALSAFTSQMPSIALEILKLKKLYPMVPIIGGGPHPTARPADVLGIGADVVVIGEGEISFPMVLLCLRDGRSYAQVNGIAYKDGGKMRKTKPAVPVILDHFTPYNPTYDEMYAPIEIQRGCFWACKYCQTGMLRKVRYRKVESILEYCQLALDRGYTDLRFVTPDAFAYGKRYPREDNSQIVRRLLEGIAHLRGKKRVFFGSFPSEVRPDSISRELLEVLNDFVEERSIHLGLQAGTNRLLKYIGRGHTVEEVYRAVDLLLEYAFIPTVHLIFGLPGEMAEDRKAALDEIKRLASVGAQVRAHAFMPLPGSPFEDEPPGRIDSETMETLRSYANDGIVVGHFHKQGDIGKETQDYQFRQGRFEILPAPVVNDDGI